MSEIITPPARKSQGGKANERLNFLWGFIGTNRTGKSVVANGYAELWRQNNPDGTIVAFDPQKRFKDVTDWEIMPDDNNDWVQDLLKLRNALVILDDYKIIHPSNQPAKGLQKLLLHRADYNIDIIYICHNPSLILNLLTYFTSHYFLFYTEAMDGSFQKKIMNYKLCTNGQRIINKYVKAYGRGTYPSFPHVIVDTEKTEINAINFLKTK